VTNLERLELYNEYHNIGIARRVISDLQEHMDGMTDKLTTVDPNNAIQIAGYQYAREAFKHLKEAIETAPRDWEDWHKQHQERLAKESKRKEQERYNVKFTPDKKEDPHE